MCIKLHVIFILGHDMLDLNLVQIDFFGDDFSGLIRMFVNKVRCLLQRPQHSLYIVGALFEETIRHLHGGVKAQPGNIPLLIRQIGFKTAEQQFAAGFLPIADPGFPTGHGIDIPMFHGSNLVARAQSHEVDFIDVHIHILSHIPDGNEHTRTGRHADFLALQILGFLDAGILAGYHALGVADIGHRCHNLNGHTISRHRNIRIRRFKGNLRLTAGNQWCNISTGLQKFIFYHQPFFFKKSLFIRNNLLRGNLRVNHPVSHNLFLYRACRGGSSFITTAGQQQCT